ncbi:MAG: hypothetical protein E6I55_07250, partial [Chloroflexi bacterium]
MTQRQRSSEFRARHRGAVLVGRCLAIGAAVAALGFIAASAALSVPGSPPGGGHATASTASPKTASRTHPSTKTQPAGYLHSRVPSGPSLASLTPTEPAGARPQSSAVSLLVHLTAGLSASQQAAVVAAGGGAERASIPALHLLVVDVSAARAKAALAAYKANHAVRSVEIDHTRAARASPSDPSYSSQWALPAIGWNNVFGSVTPTSTATVAVLDTGVDAGHADLAGKLIPGYSAFAGSDPAADPNGHGTAMAGIIAAATDNGVDIAGVAYSGVSIMPVQVLDATGVGQDSDIANGVIWAADHGAGVILMSFSNPNFSQTLQDAMSYAWSKGVVLVAATGNDGVSTPTYPAGDQYVMGVSATDQSNALASGSNSGADTFIAAPGVDITTLASGGGATSVTGTSASAAIVAGVAAFEQAVDPVATNDVIDGRIASNADPAGTQGQTGNGLVDMARTVADTTSSSAVPAGAPPVGGGGPYVGPYTAAAAADGQGAMPPSQNGFLTTSSTGHTLSLQFTNNLPGDMNGSLQVSVPSGFSWTGISSTPLAGNACQTATLTSSSGPGSGPTTVAVTIKCATPKSLTLSFSGVTAPST